MWKKLFKSSDENIACSAGISSSPDTKETTVVRGQRSASVPPNLHELPVPFSSVILQPIDEVDSTSDEILGATGGLDLSLFPAEIEVHRSDQPTSSTEAVKRKSRASSSPPSFPETGPDHYTRMRRKVSFRSPVKFTKETEEIELRGSVESRPPTKEEIELGYLGDHVYDDEDHQKWLTARRNAKVQAEEMCIMV